MGRVARTCTQILRLTVSRMGGGAEQRDPNLWAAFQSLSPLHHCFQIRFGKCYLYLRGRSQQGLDFLGWGYATRGAMTLHLPLPRSLRGGPEVKNTPRPNSVAGWATVQIQSCPSIHSQAGLGLGQKITPPPPTCTRCAEAESKSEGKSLFFTAASRAETRGRSFIPDPRRGAGRDYEEQEQRGGGQR